MRGFHSQAGWIAFTLVGWALLLCVERWDGFGVGVASRRVGVHLRGLAVECYPFKSGNIGGGCDVPLQVGSAVSIDAPQRCDATTPGEAPRLRRSVP